MEGTDNKPAEHKNEEVTVENGISNEIIQQIEIRAVILRSTVTVIDLSGRNIVTLDDKVMLPTNLMHLNLSHNKLVEVPNIILILEKLAVLNLSHNIIECFNDCPKFCHTLELLDISYNHMISPPEWIWTEAPQNLTQLNLSNNINITESFVNGYFEVLLQYNTLVTEVNIQNCRLSKYTELLSTFSKVKSLCLGVEDYTSTANSLIEIPCEGLDKCCDLISLKACNTHIYTINANIEMYKNLVEINLAQNNLKGLPNEICNLESLEICVLSFNKILYLPLEMSKLHKLRQLYLDSNELCMIPDTLSEMFNLNILDLYDNHLDEVPKFENIEEIDLAQNYFEEPDDGTYLDKKEKLRLLRDNRYNGRKNVIIKTDDDFNETSSNEDDEELCEIFYNGKKIDSPNVNPPSSPEDWDSDSHWEPSWPNPVRNGHQLWTWFVNKKMKEGNFCPMDAHPVSVMEKLSKFHKFHEVDGQFDDYSSDDT